MYILSSGTCCTTLTIKQKDNIMNNFKLNSISNVTTIATNSKAKIEAIANGDASQFFDGEKLKTQTLANFLLISAGAAKNKYDAAKGADKFEKLHNVLTNANKDGVNVEEIQTNAENALILKMAQKGKTAQHISEMLDINIDRVKSVIEANTTTK